MSQTSCLQERNCQQFCPFWSKVSNCNASPKQLPVCDTNAVRNLQWLKLRFILIKLTGPSRKSTTRFGQFTATVRRTARNKPSPKDPNDWFFSTQSSRLLTKHNVSTGGTEQNTTQRKTQYTSSQKIVGLILTCDRNRLSGQFVSKRLESPSWLHPNHW